jgi:hypothetical protein
MLTVTNNIIKTVLVSTLLVTANTVEARLKYYRYNDNIPMVEMSLNMMVAMGVLEPIPSRLVHDGNPYHRMVTASYSPYSRSAYSYPESSHRYSHYRYNDHLDGPIDPYDRYSSRYYGSRYGYSHDYPRYRTWGNQWDSPWANRWDNQWDGPWSNSWDSPWAYQRGNPWNSDWGSPWGNQWSSPWNSGWGSPWGNQRGNPWNSGWGSPWGNQWSNPWNSGYGSPWGNTWNYQWMNPWSSTTGYQPGWPYTSGYSALPLSPDQLLGNDWSKNNTYQSDDASRQYRDKEGYKAEKTSWSGHSSGVNYKRSGNTRPNRKLNGLWIGDNGEMLGIRGNRFLWYDDNQYAKGQLFKSPTMMKARIDGANSVVHYHYKLQGNELVIISRNGKMRSFNRMPLMQLQNASAKPQAAYSSYQPESDNPQVSYSSYGSGLMVNKRSLNSRNQSDRLDQAPDANRRTNTVAPRGYYSDERHGTWSTHLPYIDKGSREEISQAARPVDSGSNSYTGEVYIGDSGSASTVPLYTQYQPAAAAPKFSSSADDSVVTPSTGVNIDSSTWNSEFAGLDMDDPNTYLYSYLKDNDYTHGSVSSHSRNDSTQMNPASADQNHYYGSAAAEKSERSNIWKPNSMYPARRGNTARWSLSELAANSNMRQLGILNAGSWD